VGPDASVKVVPEEVAELYPMYDRELVSVIPLGTVVKAAHTEGLQSVGKTQEACQHPSRRQG